jgi:glycosyltransferase involved in cell wall biosynthesis
VQVASVARGQASTLAGTSRSLQNQTLARWEWVVVDRTDGSPQARRAVARLSEEPRVRVAPLDAVVPAPLGVAASGTTPYICFLRPGDLLEPTALETWVWAVATTGGVSAVGSGVVRFGASCGIDLVHSFGAGGYPGNERPPCALLVERNAYEEIGGIDPTWPADEEIEALAVTLALLGGHHIGVLPAPHTWRRVHDPADPRGAVFGSLPQVPIPRRPIMPAKFIDDPPFENPLGGDGRAVLFIVPYMMQGGSEKVALDQVRALASRGWRVTVVALERVDHTWRSAFSAATPDVHVAYETSAASGDWDRAALDLPRLLSHLVASRAIEVAVLGGTMAGHGIVPWLRRRHPQLAVAVVRHSTDWPVMSLELAPLLDAVIVSTEALAVAHRDLGVSADRVHKIATGVAVTEWYPDAERRGTMRAELDLPTDALVLAYASRLNADKQPLVFAETLSILRARGFDVFAVVTGDGPERPALERRLDDLGLTDRVRTLGAVDEATMPHLFACADVAFLPSQREGISLTLLEAMACGVPFVGTAESSQHEVVTPDVGALVARGPPEAEAIAYADALSEILRDREALAEMGRRARARIEESWSAAVMGDRLEEVLDAAIETAQRGGDDDPEALARSLAALSMHSLCVQMYSNVGINAAELVRLLEERGYDHVGRPLPDRSRDEPAAAPLDEGTVGGPHNAERNGAIASLRRTAARVPLARRTVHAARRVARRATTPR